MLVTIQCPELLQLFVSLINLTCTRLLCSARLLCFYSFVTTAEGESDQALIKVIAQTTKTLLDNIATLRSQDQTGFITMEGLASQKLPQHMDKFIFSVALAEGLTQK